MPAKSTRRPSAYGRGHIEERIVDDVGRVLKRMGSTYPHCLREIAWVEAQQDLLRLRLRREELLEELAVIDACATQSVEMIQRIDAEPFTRKLAARSGEGSRARAQGADAANE